MKTASSAIQSVGAATDPQKIQKSMMEFAKENEKMGMAQEMMDDAIDSAMDTEETEGEADEVMNQVWKVSCFQLLVDISICIIPTCNVVDCKVKLSILLSVKSCIKNI